MYFEDVTVRTMQEAVSALQHRVDKYNNEGYVESWSLCIMKVDRRDHNHNNHDDNEQNNFFWWDRYLTMLLQEGSKTQLEGIAFRASFLNRPNDQVLERLFRDVLPNLASLTRICFAVCQILPAYIDMFLKSLINNNNVNLQSLYFNVNGLEPSSVAAIAQLIRSNNGNKKPPTIENLFLNWCSIDSTSCELIFKAFDGNTCLRTLELLHNEISEISLEAAKALGNCKTLSYLDLRGNQLSDQSLCHLAEGLRTSNSIKQLLIANDGMSQVVSDAIAELLKTFNYSLREVLGIEQLQGSEKLLLQNQRIRRLHDSLREANNDSPCNNTTALAGNYQLQQLYLWPLVLECIGSKPFLIYRFVRHGNLESFTDQVLLAGSSNTLSKSILKSKPKVERSR